MLVLLLLILIIAVCILAVYLHIKKLSWKIDRLESKMQSLQKSLEEKDVNITD